MKSNQKIIQDMIKSIDGEEMDGKFWNITDPEFKAIKAMFAEYESLSVINTV